MTITEYLAEYRLAQALDLLEHTDRSITEIAQQTGFPTTSYFISIFKKKMLLPPFEYKTRSRDRQAE